MLAWEVNFEAPFLRFRLKNSSRNSSKLISELEFIVYRFASWVFFRNILSRISWRAESARTSPPRAPFQRAPLRAPAGLRTDRTRKISVIDTLVRINRLPTRKREINHFRGIFTGFTALSVIFTLWYNTNSRILFFFCRTNQIPAILQLT